MPDEKILDNVVPNTELTDGEGKTPEPVVWAEWLEKQPDGVRAAFAQYTSGLKTALDSEREQHKTLAKEKKEREQAEAETARKVLAEQGKFQEIAEMADKRAKEAEAKVAELSPLQEQIAAMQGSLQVYLNEAKKGVPEYVLALLDKLPVTEQIDYLTTHKANFKPTLNGIPPTPKPSDEKMTEEDKRRLPYFKVSL